jgi:hypothetical protein
MASPIHQQIRERIEVFVTELDSFVRQAAVESVAQALGPTGARAPSPSTAAPGRPARSRARRKGAKRHPTQLQQLTERLLAHITKNSGQGIEQIAKGMATTTKELALPARKLMTDRRIRTTGRRRGTKYFRR